MATTGTLPPRQRPTPVRQLALPTLVLVSTLVIVAVLVLFFRGTKPRRISLDDGPRLTRTTGILDGWHSGLPDEPIRTEPVQKPLPLVDEEARRDLRLMRQALQEQNASFQKSLEEIRKQMAERQQTPAQKPIPAPPPKIKVQAPESLVLYAYEPPKDADPGTGLTAGTVINVSLKTRVNSERQRVVVAEVREHIRDTRNPALVLMPQFSKVILEADPENLIAGEERVDMQLARIELPNRQTIELPKEPVVDQIGQGGLTGEIDRKWRYVLPALLLRGVFAASVQSLTTLGVPALNALQADTRQIGQVITQPSINSRPVVRIQEGERAAVILTHDLSLPVYRF
jgi:type IV secretory pathway VirB10-like protein